MSSNEQHTGTVQVAFEPADANNADPAQVGEVARAAVQGLRCAGYTVQPAYTGTRGGELFEIVRQAGQFVQDNKGVLAAMLTVATPIINFLLTQRAGRQAQAGQAAPYELLVEIGGVAVPVSAPLSDTQLLDALLASDAALPAKITPQSTVQVRVLVPAPPRRKRR